MGNFWVSKPCSRHLGHMILLTRSQASKEDQWPSIPKERTPSAELPTESPQHLPVPLLVVSDAHTPPPLDADQKGVSVGGDAKKRCVRIQKAHFLPSYFLSITQSSFNAHQIAQAHVNFADKQSKQTAKSLSHFDIYIKNTSIFFSYL